MDQLFIKKVQYAHDCDGAIFNFDIFNKIYIALLIDCYRFTAPLMVHWNTACRNDTIWELITCGFEAETYMKKAQDLCRYVNISVNNPAAA